MEKLEKPDLEIESPNLPYDIQQEILTWLPGKSLIRFQATCKLWYSWMHDPTFAKKHFDRGGHRYRCILYFLNFREGVSHIETFDGSMQPHHKLVIDLRSLPEPMRFNYKISDSCNGIVCIYKKKCENNIVLYNPLTKESVLLPEPSSLISGHDSCSYYEDVYIGFIPSMDEYKIVCIYYDNLWRLGHFAVFSLSSWSWNKITGIRIPIFVTPILVNGVMFWLSKSNRSVLWLDLATEQSGIIDLPPNIISPYNHRILLSEVEGKLVFMYLHTIDMSIWELQDVARGIWMRRASICIPIFVPVPEFDSCILHDVIMDQGTTSFALSNTILFASILGDSQKVYYLDRDDKRFGQNCLNLHLQRSLHVHSLLSLKKYVPLNCGN